MDLFDHFHVDRKDPMKILTKAELECIEGGSISASMINYIVRGVSAFVDIGRSLGSALRRIGEQNLCPLK